MTNTPLPKTTALYLRLAIGLVFGLVIGLVMPEREYGVTPEVWRSVVIGVFSLSAFVLWAGAGAMRRLTLLVWFLVAAALIAVIAWHQAAHFDDYRYSPLFFNQFFLIYPFLFISHELISSADQAGRPIAPFSLYFDEAWKRGIQLVLAIAFTGLFWAILYLGASLLKMIGFVWLKDLLDLDYIRWPLSGLAFASAVHLGDVQTRLLSSARALVLGVLSWLLPIMTLIGGLFVGSLAVSGLEPLWKTGAATLTLLSACVFFVLLINAAYQLGDDERQVHPVLKWAVRLGSGLLLVLAVLAAYSLSLRVQQYGLTPERVLAVVGSAFALLYGVGYSVSVFWPGRWMRGLEAANIALAMLKAVTLLALLTPVADPARLSVDSQVARLTTGKITVDRFDWAFLRYEAGTAGKDALKRLSAKATIPTVRAKAAEALAWADTERWEPRSHTEPQTFKPDPNGIKMVFPKGATMPANFMAQTFRKGDIACLINDGESEICEVALIDLTRDGQAELLLMSDRQVIMYRFEDNHWRQRTSYFLEENQIKAYREGRIAAQRPEIDDLKLGDKVIRY